ncbi:hypothetical protein DXG01_008224 [Tephrocybe rancida]|nr:hypothetical protein DXG01_008224 [Tephrocybe rancida]
MEIVRSGDSLEDDKTSALIARLRIVFENVVLYKKLLRCKGEEAQKVLDTFQQLLDLPELDTRLRHDLVVASQRLSKESGLYPVCYELMDVVQEGQHPIVAGGFADIYKGNCDGHVVALKAIREYQTTQVELLLKHISKEVILWGQLSHPNVLPIYGVYRFQNRICLVSPWMEAGDIAQYLKDRPGADRVQLAFDVATGLSYLHRNGIIHGDLKGPNILVDNLGRARLADFGLSSISDPDILAWTSHSSAASKGGSVRWQAPELFDVENDSLVKNTQASDVYAWACVCYEIFTGNVPFYQLLRDPTITLQVKSGARPTKPPYSSLPWHEWGLTEPVWTLMQDCWQEYPAARPTIEIARTRLIPEMVADDRSKESGEILLPALFRKKISTPLELLTPASLDLIVKDVDVASIEPVEEDDVLDSDSEDVSRPFSETLSASMVLEEMFLNMSPQASHTGFDEERTNQVIHILLSVASTHSGISVQNVALPSLESVSDDLYDRILDWNGPSDLGDLYLYDTLSVKHGTEIMDFIVYLFQRAIICVVGALPTSAAAAAAFSTDSALSYVLRLKSRIYIHQITDITTSISSAGEHGLTITMDNTILNFSLFFKDQPTMLIWKGRLENLVSGVAQDQDNSSTISISSTVSISFAPMDQFAPPYLRAEHRSLSPIQFNKRFPSPPPEPERTLSAGRHRWRMAMRRLLGGVGA